MRILISSNTGKMTPNISQMRLEAIERNQPLLAKPISRRGFLEGLSEEDRRNMNHAIGHLSLFPSPRRKVALEETLRRYTGQPCQIVTVLQTPELYEDVFITTRNEQFFYWICRINYNY